MNNEKQVDPEKKIGILNTLAIIGLIGIIISITFLSVQLVKIFPSSLASLISMADTVYNNQNHQGGDTNTNLAINITSTDIETAVAGKDITITWDNNSTGGYYTFKYNCLDGVSVSVKTDVSEFIGASCNNSYNIGLVDRMILVIESEKTENVNFNYILSYYKDNSFVEVSSISDTIKIVNQKLTEATETEVITTPATPNTEATSTIPATPARPNPTPTYTYTYGLPISNPNGFTDLSVTYLGVGIINSNNIFINQASLDLNKNNGAFQFAVKNIGNKTSNNWKFEANLPDGIMYKSDAQLSLKPNERAIVTLSFPEIERRGVKTFGVEVDVNGDSNQNNNKFSWSVVVN